MVNLTLSQLAGWGDIVARFPRRKEPSGRLHEFCSGRVGSVQYSSTLVIWTSPEGLDIVPIFFFRFGNKPIFLPWAAILNAREANWPLRGYLHFDVGNPRVGTMMLPKKILAERPTTPSVEKDGELSVSYETSVRAV